jgi:DNA-binding CsgD family transcriptional regulator
MKKEIKAILDGEKSFTQTYKLNKRQNTVAYLICLDNTDEQIAENLMCPIRVIRADVTKLMNAYHKFTREKLKQKLIAVDQADIDRLNAMYERSDW